MNKKTQEEFKKLLNTQLEALLKEAEQTAGELQSSQEKEAVPDETDLATIERDRNFLLRIRDRERKLIQKIQEALKRLEKNNFGICEGCGGPISMERLRARPVTTYCIECKTESEAKEKSLH
ncbi:MAG: RNA polymerase-binding protein DksA [Deltaproteobacteria bacterium]|nr:RNA polymerase-binding protein DksA [Deltaproteobacteria bacterium]